MANRPKDTFKPTADTIAFLNRGRGPDAPDGQNAIEQVWSEIHQTPGGTSSPPTFVFTDSDRVVPAGTVVHWVLSPSEQAEINRWPVFAIVLSWKVGSTNLSYRVSCWQYLPNHEASSTLVPNSVQQIDTWSSNISDRIFTARIRRFAMSHILLSVVNLSQYDQILSNFCVQCMIEGV